MKKKINIIPAILEKDFKKIATKVQKAKNAKAKLVQIDICDGKLTPAKTFASNGKISSFEKIKNISKNIDYELDMIVDMEEKNGQVGNKFLSVIDYLKPKRIIFHFSGVSDWEKIFKNFEKSRVKIGLGVWLSDDVKKVNKVLKKFNFDYIQIMGIEKVGYGGQKLSQKVYKKAKYFSQKYPNMPIQVDGGVKVENAKKLAKNGVTSFVAGSGIYSAENISERMKEFKEGIKNSEK